MGQPSCKSRTWALERRRLLDRHFVETRTMAKRKGSFSASGPRTISKAAEGGRQAKHVESIRLLDKLPKELWETILANLDANDLFPLALSCRYFRQKQKELVAQTTRPSGRESGLARLALKTTFHQTPVQGQPASVDYLRFCSKEEVPSEVVPQRAKGIRCLAAFNGHLPLLQELIKTLETFDPIITEYACESPSSQSRLLLVLASDFFLCFPSSQRREANEKLCSG